MKHVITSTLVLGVLFATSTLTYAHVPYVHTSDRWAANINTPIEKSVAYYMTFETSRDKDLLYFILDEKDLDPDALGNDIAEIVTDDHGVTGRKLYLGTMVPACDAYSDVRPMVAVVGPAQENLPKPERTEGLPFRMCGSEGMALLTNPEQGEAWYESYTYKSYYDQNNLDIVVNKAGLYRIYIWEPNGNVGDYVVEIGEKEVWGAAEIIRASFWIFHLVEDGEISCRECKEQLEALDGPNPGFTEVIDNLMNNM
ncbi:hypothetical protein JCM14469_24550 [Desulfatiferula olefinivorans]